MGGGGADEALSEARLISHSLTDKLLSDHSFLFTLHRLQGLQTTRAVWIICLETHCMCVSAPSYTD